MAIQIGGTSVIDNSRNINAGIATFTALNVPPIPITFSPADGATNVVATSNIVITFNGTVIKGTGNITLRSGSAGGTVIETIAVSAGTVTISGGAVTINPVSNLPFLTNVFVVVDAGAFSGLTTTSVNNIINTYDFTSADVALGNSYEGGFLICKASPLRWVVAPAGAQVSRRWYERNDVLTFSQDVTGCTGWFIPTCAQLLNPGYCCRNFWDSFTPAPRYWSSTEVNYNCAIGVYFNSGALIETCKNNTNPIRAFRCVTY